MGWKAPRLVDYSASLGCTSLFISDLDAFESLDDAALTKIREQADGKGLQIHLGTWSVCPTSKAFKPNRGTADEHLSLGIRAAKALGSPVIRVVLGTWEDRLTDGGIDRHIESLLAVCRRQRSRALDSGVKIAIENHAGDMHSTELARLVETAGTDYVGVNLDSGNALWTLEDPVDALGNLGRYTLTTSLRDSAVWETPNGAAVAWTAMGEGQIDLESFFTRFDELCPGIAGTHRDDLRLQSRDAIPDLGFLACVAGDAGARLRALSGHRETRHPACAVPAATGSGTRGRRAGLPARRYRAEHQVLQGSFRAWEIGGLFVRLTCPS